MFTHCISPTRRRIQSLVHFLRLSWVVVLFSVGLAPSAQADSRQVYLEALLDFERYAETIWYENSSGSQPPDSGYWGDGGSSGNGGIRGNCGIAVAYAVLVQAEPGNPANATRLHRIRKALNYAANTHVTGSYVCVDGSRWGWSRDDWQSPLWAGSMGFACLLVQSEMPAQTVQEVQRAVASEATHRAGIAPASGYVSDTKAEENAWQGNILALAAAWMKTNADAALWLDAAKRYLANTYTVANTSGDPLASWINTVTLYPSYALENHGFYHPTYQMVAGMSSGDSLLMARLADPTIAAELQPFAEHNILNVWSNNLRYMVMDSGELAYPSSVDWSLHDFEHNSYLAWMASHFDDPVARYADERLAQLVRYRQQVNGDGRFVGPALSNGFYREAVEARRTAIAWLHWEHADHPAGAAVAPPESVSHFNDVKILAHRSASGFVSVSYGPRIMGWIEPASAALPTNSFICTPMLRGIFGHGPLGNATAATLVNLSTNATGFAAELLLTHGTSGNTRVYVKSTGESVGIVEIAIPADGVGGADAGCFTNGIQNDPLTGSTRLLEWNGRATNITAFSGTAVNVTNGWVCVSGRHGMSAGPGGYFRYKAATGYNSTYNAAQDLLCFMPQSRFGPRYAVWFPGRSATETASLASQVAWTTNGSVVSLVFPGPTNSLHTVSASLVTGNGTWSADADGNWSDASRWSGGAIADGAGFAANFSSLNIAADRVVTLDSSRTIGSLQFGDLAGAQGWTLAAVDGSTLALSAGSPTISVLQNSATITAPLSGLGGFVKGGTGTLILSGDNALGGTWYLDGGSTSGTGHGAVRVTSTAAISGAAALSIRNNTGTANGSTLELDAAGGSIVVTPSLTTSCRVSIIPNVRNVAGSNVFAGDIYMQVGGSNVVFRSDAGTLVLAGKLQYVGAYASGRYWGFYGDGDIAVTGPILAAANGAPLTVTKYGSGTLRLDGTNTYGGATIVSAGTLGGSGSIAGPVAILTSGKLNPGGGIGRLVVSNDVELLGVTLMEITGDGPTNDVLAVAGTLARGGSLIVTNIGPVLAAGSSFRLFEAGNYSGSFNSITLPDLPGGYRWDTSQLNAGTLTLQAAAPPQLAWSASSGTGSVSFSTEPGFDYILQTSTNLGPGAIWQNVQTNAGGAVVHYPVPTPALPQQFYRVRVQQNGSVLQERGRLVPRSFAFEAGTSCLRSASTPL